MSQLCGHHRGAVTGRSNSADLLEALERTNGFVIPLDRARVFAMSGHLRSARRYLRAGPGHEGGRRGCDTLPRDGERRARPQHRRVRSRRARRAAPSLRRIYRKLDASWRDEAVETARQLEPI